MKNLIFASLSMFFLTACSRMEITQTIYSDYSADVTIFIDMSATFTLLHSIEDAIDEFKASNPAAKEDVTLVEEIDMCAEFSSQWPAMDEGSPLQEITCEQVAEYAIQLHSKGSIPSEELSIERVRAGTKYRYKLADLARVLSTKDLPVDLKKIRQESEGGQRHTDDTITIVMPAPIMQSPIGRIDGNTVTFTLYELSNTPRAVVEAMSQEKSIPEKKVTNRTNKSEKTSSPSCTSRRCIKQTSKRGR